LWFGLLIIVLTRAIIFKREKMSKYKNKLKEDLKKILLMEGSTEINKELKEGNPVKEMYTVLRREAIEDNYDFFQPSAKPILTTDRIEAEAVVEKFSDYDMLLYVAKIEIMIGE
jgi:hypothetical protein